MFLSFVCVRLFAWTISWPPIVWQRFVCVENVWQAQPLTVVIWWYLGSCCCYDFFKVWQYVVCWYFLVLLLLWWQSCVVRYHTSSEKRSWKMCKRAISPDCLISSVLFSDTEFFVPFQKSFNVFTSPKFEIGIQSAKSKLTKPSEWHFELASFEDLSNVSEFKQPRE